jgi:hypothetical protein
MPVEQLRQISTINTLDPMALEQADDLQLDFSVNDASTDTQLAREIRFSCSVLSAQQLLGEVKAAYLLILDAGSVPQSTLEAYLVNLVWPYFRQHVLGAPLAVGSSASLELPVECPMLPEVAASPRNQKPEDQTSLPPAQKPWEAPWQGELSDSSRVFLRISRLLDEIHSRKQKWFLSVLKLYVYVYLLQRSKRNSLFSTDIFILNYAPELLEVLGSEFGFSIEEWWLLEHSIRKHLIRLIEETLTMTFESVIWDDANPQTSVVPDEFIEGVDELLDEVEPTQDSDVFSHEIIQSIERLRKIAFPEGQGISKTFYEQAAMVICEVNTATYLQTARLVLLDENDGHVILSATISRIDDFVAT